MPRSKGCGTRADYDVVIFVSRQCGLVYHGTSDGRRISFAKALNAEPLMALLPNKITQPCHFSVDSDHAMVYLTRICGFAV